MCGICAIYNLENAPYKIVDMIVAQESRGQDSTGVAYIENDSIHVLKRAIRPEEFRDKYKDFFKNVNSKVCIGHNRLASTNIVDKHLDSEAHPFLSEDGEFAIVHNGTFIGHSYLAHFLDNIGHKRSSGVDTEIFVHILEELLKRYNREEAIKKFYPLSEGNILILFRDGELYGIPGTSFEVLVAGNTVYIASEASTFKTLDLPENAKLYIPNDGSLIRINSEGVEMTGEWSEKEYKKGSWIYNTEIVCDFCRVKKPCEKIELNGNKYDRCYDCYKQNKTTPLIGRREYSEYISHYISYYDSGWPLEKSQKEEKKIEYGICKHCKRKILSSRIILCSKCSKTYCLEHLMIHECSQKEEDLEVIID